MTEEKKLPETVHELLFYLQKYLKVPKNQYNSFGKYKYRNVEDIQIAVKQILSRVKGATLTFTDEIVHLGERYYVKSTCVLSYNGDQVSTSAFAREADSKKGMDSSQLTGACSSYARKYAAGAMFLLDDQKDHDYQSGG